MEIVAMFLLASSISMDGLGAGLAYGLRKVQVPFLSIVIVALTSGVTVYLSMAFGGWLEGFIPAGAAEKLGAAILICVGLWVVYQNRHQNEIGLRRNGGLTSQEVQTLLSVHLRSQGLVIKVLREPLVADLDQSGKVTAWEAALLGFALALDAFGAGLGAGFAGFSPIWTPVLVGTVKFLFLGIGIWSGRKWAITYDRSGVLLVLPGLILVGLGAMWLL